jgi:hypothetical protein
MQEHHQEYDERNSQSRDGKEAVPHYIVPSLQMIVSAS